jgi:ABC-2 type transport system ATP-binding protein
LIVILKRKKLDNFALEISNLKKVYSGGTEALKGISLKVKEGDFYALLGPNGAGKSSTIGIIGTLVTKTEGNVKIFGYDIDENVALAKSLLGVVSQEINFSQFEKIIDIVTTQAGFYGISNSIAKPKVEEMLKRLGLWDKRNDQARTLSGGYKRRLMIAKALIHEPKLLILDEPTAGVDIELRREMWTFLKEINQNGTTIILTTHYLEEAEQLCRNIGIIDHGEIVVDTSMKDLLSRLDVQGFVLDLEEPLDQAPIIDGFELRLDDPLTLVTATNKEKSINSLFDELNKIGIKVKSMRNESNRLEELFIEMIKK